MTAPIASSEMSRACGLGEPAVDLESDLDRTNSSVFSHGGRKCLVQFLFHLTAGASLELVKLLDNPLLRAPSPIASLLPAKMFIVYWKRRGPVGMSDKPLIDRPAGPNYGTRTSELSFPCSSKAFTRLLSVSDAASTVSGGPTAPVNPDQTMLVSDISRAGWTSIEILALSLHRRPFVKNVMLSSALAAVCPGEPVSYPLFQSTTIAGKFPCFLIPFSATQSLRP